jgi:RNA polymerase sigma-70 factor (ECF subfamily)
MELLNLPHSTHRVTRLFRSGPLLAVGTNLRAWLYAIMHHQDADVVRASVRENSAVKVDDTWPFLITPTDPTATLSLRGLDRALARISEEQRQIILQIGLEELQYEEER